MDLMNFIGKNHSGDFDAIAGSSHMQWLNEKNNWKRKKMREKRKWERKKTEFHPHSNQVPFKEWTTAVKHN